VRKRGAEGEGEAQGARVWEWIGEFLDLVALPLALGGFGAAGSEFW
jgi:hypothetical protein